MKIDYYKEIRSNSRMGQKIKEMVYLNTGKWDPFEILSAEQIRLFQKGLNPATHKPLVSATDFVNAVSIIKKVSDQNAQRNLNEIISIEQKGNTRLGKYIGIGVGIIGLLGLSMIGGSESGSVSNDITNVKNKLLENKIKFGKINKAGWILPDGTQIDLDENKLGTHSLILNKTGYDYENEPVLNVDPYADYGSEYLLSKGWIRNYGRNYEIKSLSSNSVKAIESSIGFSLPKDSVIRVDIRDTNKFYEISADDYISSNYSLLSVLKLSKTYQYDSQSKKSDEDLKGYGF